LNLKIYLHGIQFMDVVTRLGGKSKMTIEELNNTFNDAGVSFLKKLVVEYTIKCFFSFCRQVTI